MPTVQRYGQRQIRTAALPGVRRTAAETALSRGAGVEQAKAATAETIGRVGSAVASFGLQQYAEIQRQARERADAVARLSWQNRLAQFETDAVYSPETGIAATRGAAAMELPERVLGEFQKLVTEIEAGLTTDAQRLAFAADVQAARATIYAKVQSHVSSEITKLEANELTAFVENQRSLAIANADDLPLVGRSLAEMTDAIRRHGANVGMGPEQIEQAIAAQRSAVHAGIIDRYLTRGQQQAAQVYFEETRSEISGESIAKIEQALSVGRVRAEGQRLADEILAGGGTLAEQRERARAIADPEVRDNVMSRLEHEAQIRARVEAEQHETRLRGVYDILDRSPDVDRIPPSVWAQMSGAERTAAMNYARRRALGEPIETDYATYYSIMNQAASDPGAFARRNLLDDRARLGDAEFKQLAQMQLALRTSGDGAASEELASFSTKTEILKDALEQYGFPEALDAEPGTPEAKAVAQLRRLVDVQVAALGPGAKPSSADIRSIIDAIMATEAQRATPAPFWSVLSGMNPNLAAPTLGVMGWHMGLGIFRSQERKLLIEGTIADVPRADRLLIEEALRANGLPVTDVTILETWQLRRLADENVRRASGAGQ